jgi:hypothetical protein
LSRSSPTVVPQKLQQRRVNAVHVNSALTRHQRFAVPQCMECCDNTAWFTIVIPLFDRLQAASRSSGSCHDIALPPPHYLQPCHRSTTAACCSAVLVQHRSSTAHRLTKT